MNYIKLGRTNIEVSELALGCEGFSGKSKEETKSFLTMEREGAVGREKDKKKGRDRHGRAPFLRSLRGRMEFHVLF